MADFSLRDTVAEEHHAQTIKALRHLGFEIRWDDIERQYYVWTKNEIGSTLLENAIYKATKLADARWGTNDRTE